MADLPIPGEWIVQGGAVTLLLLVAYFVFTGKLVPRSVLRDLERDRDYWRQIAIQSIGHTDQLLPAAHIASQVSRALTDEVAAQTERALGDVRAKPEPPEAMT